MYLYVTDSCPFYFQTHFEFITVVPPSQPPDPNPTAPPARRLPPQRGDELGAEALPPAVPPGFLPLHPLLPPHSPFTPPCHSEQVHTTGCLGHTEHTHTHTHTHIMQLVDVVIGMYVFRQSGHSKADRPVILRFAQSDTVAFHVVLLAIRNQ